MRYFFPFKTINSNSVKTKLSKNKKYIVYCRTGKRAKEAYKKLVSYGYDVKYLVGDFRKLLYFYLYKYMNLINHRSKFFINGYKKYIYLKNSIDNNLFGLITPHAGLSYCGELLEYAYSEVNWDKFNKVILLSTHHKPWNSIPKPSKTFSLSEDLILNIDDFVGLDEFVEKSDDDCLNLSLFVSPDAIFIIIKSSKNLYYIIRKNISYRFYNIK